MNNIGQGRPLSFDFVLEALTRSIPAEQIESVLVQVQGKRRVIKVKMSKWKKKRPQHLNPPQPKKTFMGSVIMLK